MNANLLNNAFSAEVARPERKSSGEDKLLDIKKEIAIISHALNNLREHASARYGATDELTIKIEDFWWQTKRWADRLDEQG